MAGIGVLWISEMAVLTRYKEIFRGLLFVVICIIMLLLGQLTIKQIRVWRNPEILWSYVIDAFPERVALAHNNLGFAYRKKGRLDEAIFQYRQALAINLNYIEAYNNLGSVYDKKVQLRKDIEQIKQDRTLTSCKMTIWILHCVSERELSF